MPLTMHGHWRLQVTAVHGAGNNRFVVSGAASGNGTFPLTVGTVIEVNGLPEWQLDAQFEDLESPGSWISVELQIQEQDRTRASLGTTIWSFHTVTGDSGGLLVPRGDVWSATFIGPMMEIPWRPWAVRESSSATCPKASCVCFSVRSSWMHRARDGPGNGGPLVVPGPTRLRSTSCAVC